MIFNFLKAYAFECEDCYNACFATKLNETAQTTYQERIKDCKCSTCDEVVQIYDRSDMSFRLIIKEKELCGQKYSGTNSYGYCL